MKRAVDIAFLFLIFSTAFMQPSTEAFGPALTLTEPLFVLTAVTFLIAVASRKLTVHIDRIYVLFGLYAAALTLSAIFSSDPRHSSFRLLGEFYLIGLAVLTLNVVRTPEMMRKVIIVWLAASAASAVIGVCAVICFYLGVTNAFTDIAFHYYGTLPPGNYVRIQGTFLYPSMLCNYLTVSFLMLLAARRLCWIAQPLFISLTIIFSITAAFTLTPGLGGMMLAISAWLWLVFREGQRLMAARLFLFGGVLAAVAFQIVSTFTPIPLQTSPYFFEFFGWRIDPTQRLLAWSQALQTFFQHPLFGKGVGQNVAEVYVLPPQGEMRLITDAHNTALSVAAQYGILGLASVTALVIAVVKRTLPFDLHGQNALKTALGIAFLSAFIVQGMVGSFEDARHLWVLMGLVLSPGLSPSEPKSTSPLQRH